MISFSLRDAGPGPLSVLALGAHPDDVEIAAGGTLLTLAERHPGMRVRYVLLTGEPERQIEARTAARAFTPDAGLEVELHGLPEGRLPAAYEQVKEVLEDVARSFRPDVILTPSPQDAHQDHRMLGGMVPTAFRDHAVLNYEIPKWDGDLRQPNVYVPLSDDIARRKVELLNKCFPSQLGRDWWDEETFLGLARLRGIECRARYAEAFTCTKLVISLSAQVRLTYEPLSIDVRAIILWGYHGVVSRERSDGSRGAGTGATIAYTEGSTMYAYVINLARSKDRHAHMTAELEKTGMDYEFISAVDGRGVDMSDPKLVSADELTTKSQFPANTAGTVLSHIRCYERMLAAGRDTALVLEDDIILPADVDSLADSVAGLLTGAEVALLSFDSIKPLKISREGAVQVLGDRMLTLPIDAMQPASGGAYVITREACERLIKFALPVRANPDEWGYFYREAALDRVRCVVPLSVRKTAKLSSTQGSYALGNSLRFRLLWPIVKLELPVLHQILVHRRQRILERFAHWEIVDIPFIEKPSRLD